MWYNSPALVANNTIAYNTASIYGGGIYIYEAGATVEYNILYENHADAYGGAFYCRYTPLPTIRHNVMIYNSANKGGAFYLSHCPVTITNCHMYQNSADRGGAIFNILSDYTTVINCTFYRNRATTYGGGFYQNRSPDVVVKNTIFWRNKPEEIYTTTGQDPHVSYSNVKGGYAGEGNINSDPHFVTGPLGNRYLAQVSAHQPLDSPCVNAGEPGSPMIDGTTRTDSVQDSDAVDIGYYHPIYCLSNYQVSPAVGSINDLYTYTVDVQTEDEMPPHAVYLKIDGQYAGEMVLTSGTPGNGTYSFATYLTEPGYHDAVFYLETGPQRRIPGRTTGLYTLPSEQMQPFNLPLVTDLLQQKDNAQPAVGTLDGTGKKLPAGAGN
jgi:hypothetical protein